MRTARRDVLLTARKHAIARWRSAREQQRQAAAQAAAAAAAAAGSACASNGTARPDLSIHTGSLLFTAAGGNGGQDSNSNSVTCARAAARAARLREWREARVRSAHEEEAKRMEEEARAAAAAEASAKRRQVRSSASLSSSMFLAPLPPRPFPLVWWLGECQAAAGDSLRPVVAYNSMPTTPWLPRPPPTPLDPSILYSPRPRTFPITLPLS